jgi:hypothetical protein
MMNDCFWPDVFSNVRSAVASGGNADLVSEIDRDQYWPSEKQRDAM